jgi:hypothetical protein
MLEVGVASLMDEAFFRKSGYPFHGLGFALTDFPERGNHLVGDYFLPF